MKSLASLLLLVGLGVFTLGCGGAADAPVDGTDAAPPVVEVGEEVTEEVTEEPSGDVEEVVEEVVEEPAAE